MTYDQNDSLEHKSYMGEKFKNSLTIITDIITIIYSQFYRNVF